MQTIAIPALSDNIIYLVVDGGIAVVVDPGDAGPVFESLHRTGAKLAGILLTHSHGDHTAGAPELRKTTGCAVMGPVECRGVGLDRVVAGGDRLSVGPFAFAVLATPGHTAGHVCYHLPATDAVWTGDTLFVGGCGRIQVGRAEAMWQSLCLLRDLSPDTAVHTGHDYTMDNLEFALEVLPGDPALMLMRSRALDLIKSGKSAASSTIAGECESNIFLRADTGVVRTALGMSGASPLAVFAELRRRKDEW